MRRRNIPLLAGLAIGALVLGACGESTLSTPLDAAVASPVRPVVIGEKLSTGFGNLDESRAAPESAPAREIVVVEVEAERAADLPPAAAEMALAAPLEARVAQQASTVTSDEAGVDRKIIRSATLAIVVADLEQTVSRVKRLVEGIPGAFVAGSSIQADDPMLVSSMTLRVPSAEFEAVMAALRGVGVDVIDEDIRSQDVTAEFTDISARLRNAEASERQLLDILARARTVEDTLAVQRELAAVRERIEVMQGRLNLLRNQTDLATITLRLHPTSDLALTRELPGDALMHEQVMLGFTVTNEGTVDLEQVKIRERLDAGMIFVAASDDGAYDPAAHMVVWEIERLRAGEQRRFYETLRLEGDGSDMGASAEVSTASPERNPDNNVAAGALRFHVDLSIGKDGSIAVPVGRDAEYTLAFGNRGTADATDVKIIERLPEGMSFVRAGGGGRYDAARHAVVWEFARLQPGAFDQVTYVARVERSEGRLQTDTIIESAQPDRAAVDNTATTFLTALSEEVAGRDVWSPGNTARDGLDALTGTGQWLADAAIKVGIVGGPIAVVLAVLALPARALWRWRVRRA